MKAFLLLAAIAALAVSSQADISYKTTRRITGGVLANSEALANNPQVYSYYLKGQKMAIVLNDRFVQTLDFDAHTATDIYKGNQTYVVRRFDDLKSGTTPDSTNAMSEARETGRKRTLDGSNATELLMIAAVTGLQPAQAGKMKVEIGMWMSKETPGTAELRDFYRKNAGNFAWTAIGCIDTGIPLLLPSPLQTFVSCFDWSGCRANPSVEAAVARLQGSIASVEGIPVEQVVRFTAPVSGPWAALAGNSSGSSDPLIETTIDYSDFSTSRIPDSVFAVPDRYKEGPSAVSNWGDPLSKLGNPSVLNHGVASDGVSKPSLISRVEPEYTKEAVEAKLSGTILLSLIVDAEGRARDIHVMNGLGMGLDQQAVKAVEKWKFKPAMKGGVPVNMRVQVQVNFRFEDRRANQ